MESDDYSPVSWCVLCGWFTDDPRDTACDCDDGIPRC